MTAMQLSLEGFKQFAEKCVLDTGGLMHVEPFQEALVTDFTDPAFKEIWCVMPEASAKSTLMALYSLYVLIAVPGATVTIASVSMSQAGSALFRQASDVVARTPGLDRHLRVFDGKLRILGPNRSRLEVKPSTPALAAGAIPTVVIIDEVGELKDLELPQMLRGKLSKRAGSRLIVVSSAGEPGSDFEHVLSEIRSGSETSQRDGRHSRYVSGSTCVHEYRLEPGDAVTDWSLLKSANPLASVTEESLRDKFESPLTDESHFKRYTGGVAEYSADHCVRPEVWAAARLAEGEHLGEVVRECIGVDFGAAWDALGVVGCLSFADGTFLLGNTNIIEPGRPGQPIELAAMQKLLRTYTRPDEFYVNPAAGSSPLQEWLTEEFGVDVVLYGTNQPEAVELTAFFMAKLHGGQLRHTGDDVLTQHALNATPRVGWDSRFAFTRPQTSRTAKNQRARRIDALSAATLALWGAAHPPPQVDQPFVMWI
jgi:phage terminase large subunit-like protein